MDKEVKNRLTLLKKFNESEKHRIIPLIAKGLIPNEWIRFIKKINKRNPNLIATCEAIEIIWD